MSTAANYLKSVQLSHDHWIAKIQKKVALSPADQETCFRELLSEVDETLPGNLLWYPWNGDGEVNGEVGDPAGETLTLHDFAVLANPILREVLSDWGAQR